MRDWREVWSRFRDTVGVVFVVLFGLAGVVFAVATFGFAGAVVYYVLLAAVLVLTALALYALYD